MNQDSFDPKQWAAKPDVSGPAAAPEADGSAFWREAVAAPSGPGPAAPAPISDATASRRAIVGGLSLSVLVLTGVAAWRARKPSAAAPVAAPASGPKPQEGAASGLVERALNLRGADQLPAVLVQSGVSADEAATASRMVVQALGGATGELRAIMVLEPRAGGSALRQLHASLPDGSGVALARQSDGTFAATRLAVDLTRQIRVLRGEIDSDSFYTSAVSAGLVDTLIPEFINAFSFDFNLAAEVAPGDTFEVAYDQAVNARGEPVGAAKLLYAELNTPKKNLALYRFEAKAGEGGWFDGNGATTKRGLMRTPVDGARISSKFGMRFHPVLHYNKLHGGTDFAAPSGTPIYAAADGVVLWAALKGANGNLTILRHDNGWETFYLHQSAFAPGIAPGNRVTQGQHIGDIGTTGRSTGPHLHYEVHIDGERVDPLGVPTDDAKRTRLDGAMMQAFLKERDRIDLARARGSG